MNLLTISPNKIFESAKDGIIEVSSFYASRAVSANNVAVAAVAGKRIRVLGLTAQSDGAATGVLSFLSGSGGTLLWYFNTPPNTAAIFKADPNMLGIFETDTGVGLYDTVVTTAQFYCIQYVTYTP